MNVFYFLHCLVIWTMRINMHKNGNIFLLIYFLSLSWGRCVGGKTVLCSLWCPFGILQLGRHTMQLWKLDNTSFSTTQKSGRYKPRVSVVAPLYTYTHVSIREATFSPLFLDLHSAQIFQAAQLQMKLWNEVLFIIPAQDFEAKQMQLWLRGL